MQTLIGELLLRFMTSQHPSIRDYIARCVDKINFDRDARTITLECSNEGFAKAIANPLIYGRIVINESLDDYSIQVAFRDGDTLRYLPVSLQVSQPPQQP